MCFLMQESRAPLFHEYLLPRVSRFVYALRFYLSAHMNTYFTHSECISPHQFLNKPWFAVKVFLQNVHSLTTCIHRNCDILL